MQKNGKFTIISPGGIMIGPFFILLFVILLAVPGFYLITRALFPKQSKRSARMLSYILTALLVAILATAMFTQL